MAQVDKQFRYSIYTQNGDYVTDWVDVVSDPAFNWNINNGLAELVVKLARPFNNFGEGVDVNFENELRLYAIDKEAPQGVLIYSGRLNEYRPHFTGNTDSEYVEVQFLGYTSQLDDRILHDRTSSTVVDFVESDSSTQAVNLTYQRAGGNPAGPYDTFAMPFIPDISNVTGLIIPINSVLATHPPITVGIMYADIQIWQSQTGQNVNIWYPGVVIASGVISANSLPITRTATTVLFPNTTYGLTPGQGYFAFVAGSGVQVYMNASSPGSADVWGTRGGADNRTGYVDEGGTPGNFNDLQFSTLFDSTAPSYTDTDPYSMINDFLTTKYSGKITFDTANSQPTGAVADYQFNMQTLRDAVNKATELSPPYWFWRTGADNRLVFRRRDDATIDHVLRLGFEITDATPIKSVNKLKTRVVFYGGSEVGKPELVFVDDRVGMQTQYTVKEEVLRDARVLLSDSASLLTHDYLDSYGNPEVQMTVTVADSNGDYTYGYDIESFKPGQRIQIVDPTQDAFKAIQGTFDNSYFDVDNWDTVDLNLLATPLQIQRVEYKTDFAVLTLAAQIDTSSRTIQDDKNNLLQTQTANAPGA